MADRQIMTGEVRKLEKRSEKAYWWADNNAGTREIYAFVVEQFDDEGNVRPAAAVEMSSRRGFAGLLSEGDQVAFFADKQDRSGAFKVGAIRNLSAGTLFGDRRAVKRGDVPAP